MQLDTIVWPSLSGAIINKCLHNENKRTGAPNLEDNDESGTVVLLMHTILLPDIPWLGVSRWNVVCNQLGGSASHPPLS